MSSGDRKNPMQNFQQIFYRKNKCLKFTRESFCHQKVENIVFNDRYENGIWIISIQIPCLDKIG